MLLNGCVEILISVLPLTTRQLQKVVSVGHVLSLQALVLPVHQFTPMIKKMHRRNRELERKARSDSYSRAVNVTSGIAIFLKKR